MAAPVVVGLDIGTFITKATVISYSSKLPTLVGFGSIKTPQPGFISDNDLDHEHLAGGIKSLLESLKAPTNAVCISLPESKIYSKIIPDLPFLSDDEVGSAIKYSIDDFVPLAPEEIELYWQIVDRSKEQNKTVVLVIAVPKRILEKYMKVLDLARIKPIAIETEMISASRLLQPLNLNTYLLIQFGASTTDISVISANIPILTRSLTTGGLAITRTIAQSLNFEPLQAEEYKKVYGILPDALDSKIFEVVKPLVELITAESERIIQSYQSKNPNNPLQKIILLGGGAKLPGLINYIGARLGVQPTICDPWSFIQKDPSLAPKLTIDPLYSVSAGLALRRE